MNAILVRDAADRLGCSPERVFGLAFEYWETPVSRKYIVEAFLDWYHTGKINQTVQDYILDILAGRTTR